MYPQKWAFCSLNWVCTLQSGSVVHIRGCLLLEVGLWITKLGLLSQVGLLFTKVGLLCLGWVSTTVLKWVCCVLFGSVLKLNWVCCVVVGCAVVQSGSWLGLYWFKVGLL